MLGTPPTKEHAMTRTAVRLRAAAALGGLTSLLLLGAAGPAEAASSRACAGGGFALVNLTTGATVAEAGEDRVRTTLPAARLGDRFEVKGRYVRFEVRSTDFAVLDQSFTGAQNSLDLTGGHPTPVFASKVPDHRGLTLTSGVAVRLDEEELRLERTGPGLSMKIQAKDCAQGGIFQMEPEREDGAATRVVHTLAESSTPGLTPFYYDNPAFRERGGQYLGSACTSAEAGPPSQFCVRVSPRTNIGNDLSPAFVARDSAQQAERVDEPDCGTVEPVTPAVDHCGGTSVWDVASGGRMGFVTGEDAVEVANPPTECVTDCQAQNQVRGRLAVLGFPFPVPDGSRLTPRAAPVPAP
jgi:hypothetical protein